MTTSSAGDRGHPRAHIQNDILPIVRVVYSFVSISKEYGASSMMRYLVFVIAVYGLASTVRAAPIRFTYTGTVSSGSIGETTFSDSQFTIIGFGDTNNRFIRNPDGGLISIDHELTSISLADLGHFSILNPLLSYVDYGKVGLSRAIPDDRVLLKWAYFSADIDGWSMTTSLGPYTGIGTFLQWTQSPPIVTNAGELLMFGDISDLVFQAVIVPENMPTWVAVAGFYTCGILTAFRRR
jgi:hypothetical protein